MNVSYSSEKDDRNEHCFCNNQNISYGIIENYHSILNRKQKLISTWKIFDNHGKVSFTHGTHHRKGTDALIMRLNHICLINPWYKYTNADKHLISIVKNNHCSKVFEIILLECSCLNEYELAIIECPCLEQMKTYCSYCRSMLTATESSSNRLLKNVTQQTESTEELRNLSSLTSYTFNDVENSLSESKVQSSIPIESEELPNSRNQETQTNLFAILLPESPLNEMKSAVTAAKTSVNVTHICQVNTLSYLIKTNESQTDLPQMDCSSSTSFLRTDSQLIEDLSTEESSFSNKLSENIQYHKYDPQQIVVPIIQFDEELVSVEEQPKESIFALSTLKCINACETSKTSFLIDNDPPICDANNNCEQLTFDYFPSTVCQPSKLFWLKNKYCRFISRKRRRNRNKKRVYGFLRRLCRQKKSNTVELVSSKQNSPPCDNQDGFRISRVKQQPSTVDLQLTEPDTIRRYKSINHTIIARASQNSIGSKQLRTLVNNDDTLLEELIDFQLTLTCDTNCKSICILIDDHKQSERYRSSFLHYIYTTLSNTLKTIIDKSSIKLTCMNLAFFNNSLCDLVNMRRLRLIDTGRKILLQPSCEVPLKTADDITIAVNRLSTNMSFAHQILIINFSHERSSLSGSFFFLQLAPICSIRPTGLFTNLNSTTYSVLNLIRKFNHGQLFHHNTAKRYLLNDCSLNRLLKSYLFSSQQTISVITVKPVISK